MCCEIFFDTIYFEIIKNKALYKVTILILFVRIDKTVRIKTKIKFYLIGFIIAIASNGFRGVTSSVSRMLSRGKSIRSATL